MNMLNNPSNHEDVSVVDAVMVQIPRMAGVNNNLQRVTEHTRTRGRPTNTAKAYDGKRAELMQYLETVWEHDPYPRLLNDFKVYRFIFYQCAREQRLQRRGQRDTGRLQFDWQDYVRVMEKYDIRTHNNETPFIEPKKGIKFQALRQYKAVIKEVFQEQLEHHTKGWEFIWTPGCNILLNIV